METSIRQKARIDQGRCAMCSIDPDRFARTRWAAADAVSILIGQQLHAKRPSAIFSRRPG